MTIPLPLLLIFGTQSSKRLCNLDLRHFKIFSASSEFINLQHGRDFGRFPLSGKR
jgi:hypothetical protein